MNNALLGGISALFSSASWAFGSVLWRKIGTKLTPEGMNLFKGIIGCCYLALPALAGERIPLDVNSVLLLSLSGLIGISFGDTFFFKALINLGPRQTSLIGTLTPGFTAIAATFVFQEKLPFLIWAGVALTLFGVFWVLSERIPGNGNYAIDKKTGIKYCLLSILCNVISILLAKAGLTKLPAMQAAFIRLLWGTAGLAVWGFCFKNLKEWISPASDKIVFSKMLGIVAVVVFGGFWLSLYALKHVDTAIASTLGSTSPLFVLPLSAVLLKEKITWRSCCGAAIAVVGVAFLFIGK
jgi:drug/metabolite transporter (DMT)-like permease